ncbi:ABC transporter ATP-binding protein [Clostridium saccharoperbutylacetonicum]|uniref:ABC transporter ATP-binding protein n=1 Tax=Clostridium saccharoperbutylacetonicum TaxID=36745 RepID=UPI000983F423|nr:ABC transporter ATP-binding protein [Clostridium saccharoperbutylacetonicum]AQR97838.1 teichoic acids export ATP-binding protein TagH [Clostridium saccharoperbutylacetonicum]NSB33730.1 ABC-2 type transport system ATP-binding protein [Clostridium saccharoperbutylacetonicum]
MIEAKNITMKFDLNRGKVRSLKERLFAKVDDEALEKKPFLALNDVSFDVKKGEILGIIGGNGAGKSTLLKILAGIMKPSSGQVTVKGTIAPMIELGTGFDFELSALENIYLSGAVLGYSKNFINSKVVEIFDFSELWDFKDVPVKYFSSGMVARLAFAVSTIVVPDVLIVDEILSVGDMSFQKKSYKRMKELMCSGSTVIYVSHDVESLGKMCDRVIWIDKGTIKMIGEAKKVCEAFIDAV